MRIVSGGQTGADRAALDVARELGLANGGFVPRGRRAEDGRIPDRYEGLVELESGDYRVRTERNVVTSDATVVVAFGPLQGGSALTARLASRHGKPLLMLDLETLPHTEACRALRGFVAQHQPETLNVAGPRQSQDPRIYAATRRLLHDSLSERSR